MPLHIDGGHGRGGIRQFVNDADEPTFLERELMWMGTGRSEFKWTDAHLQVLRTYDLFLQCKMHYISYIGVRTPGWRIHSR